MGRSQGDKEIAGSLFIVQVFVKRSDYALLKDHTGVSVGWHVMVEEPADCRHGLPMLKPKLVDVPADLIQFFVQQGLISPHLRNARHPTLHRLRLCVSHVANLK